MSTEEIPISQEMPGLPSMNSNVLHERLRATPENVLLLDIRSCINYRRGCIKSAINVFIPKVLLQKVTSLDNITKNIATSDERTRIAHLLGDADVVLYDQNSTSLAGGGAIQTVWQKLRGCCAMKSSFWLEGLT